MPDAVLVLVLELEPELITPALMGPNNAKWSSATSGAGSGQGEGQEHTKRGHNSQAKD